MQESKKISSKKIDTFLSLFILIPVSFFLASYVSSFIVNKISSLLFDNWSDLLAIELSIEATVLFILFSAISFFLINKNMHLKFYFYQSGVYLSIFLLLYSSVMLFSEYYLKEIPFTAAGALVIFFGNKFLRAKISKP